MWFYKDGEREIGPVSKNEIQDLIKVKRITLKTLIRREDMREWRPLSEMVKPKTEKQTPKEDLAEDKQPGIDETLSKKPESKIQSRNWALFKEIPFQFKGSGGEYFKIWIVNVLLSILTFGIYSAWAKVRRKQYFYSNTKVAGATFRYLANPVKIFIGRIIVFVFFIIYSIINNFFPPVSVLFGIGVIFLLPWLVVRSLAFNAHNSSLRNIQFNFAGTYGQAAKAYILFPFLGLLTLGFLSPYAYFRQRKFIVENSAYGTTQFRFKATAKDYYYLILRFFLPIIILIVSVGTAAYFLSFFAASFKFPNIATAAFSYVPSITFIFVMLLYLYALAYFSVKSSNLLYNSSELSDHCFSANMMVKDYAIITFTNTLATVVTLGLFYPFAQLRATKYKIENLSLLPGSDLDQFIAAETKGTDALGEELSEFMDFDFGF
jgi:uncharacterized membrane protein YjgN (DUF898 family)